MKLRHLLFLFLPLSAFADGGLPSQPYIYVEGTARIQKAAETVTLRYDLTARNPDQAKANQETQAKAAQILAMLNERRIAERDVIAQDLKTAPVYDDPQNRHAKIIGYSVTRSFQVKLRDLGLFSKLIDDLLAIGGVEFTGVESGLTNETEAEDEMWTKALTNARESADKTLKVLGMKIDGVFAVSPVSIPEVNSRMFNRGEQVIVTGSYMPAESKVDAKHYLLEPVTVSQSVHIFYLISPVK